MNKLFGNDTFLKIFSLVASILCWIYIVFVNNPTIEVKVKGVPITLSDHQSIKNEGYIVSTDLNQTVDLKLKGSRKMLAGINKDNIIAYVDLSGCTEKKSYKLPVSIKLPYDEVKIVSKSIYNVNLTVDNLIKREFEIECVYTGEPISSDYSVNSTELEREYVKVSGPEDIVKTIEKAEISINIDKVSSDVTDTSKIVFLNSNRSVVNSKAIVADKAEIGYQCKIFQRKSVKVKPNVSADSEVKATVTDHPTVTLIGPSAEVDKITEIETAFLNCYVSDLPQNYTAKLNVPKNIDIEEEISAVNILVEKND